MNPIRVTTRYRDVRPIPPQSQEQSVSPGKPLVSRLEHRVSQPGQGSLNCCPATTCRPLRSLASATFVTAFEIGIVG